MHKKSIFLFIFAFLLSLSLNAQQAIIDLSNPADDDTLPIANTRYDDAVEPPKDNFSSVGKQDMWEKFERGELDEKAFLKLQEDYQMQASSSKDPIVKRKIASDMKEKRREAFKKRKEERALKLAEEKKNKKKAEANRFDTEIDLMAKEKEMAQKKADAEAKAIEKSNAKSNAKSKALSAKAKSKAKIAKKAAAKKRMPASKKKLSKKKK